MYFFLQKYRASDIRYEILLAPTEKASCKKYKCCREAEGMSKAIAKGELKVEAVQNVGDYEKTGFYKNLGGYHWDCFIDLISKPINPKYQDHAPVTPDNIYCKKYLDKSDMNKILDSLQNYQVTEELLYRQIGGVPKKKDDKNFLDQDLDFNTKPSVSVKPKKPAIIEEKKEINEDDNNDDLNKLNKFSKNLPQKRKKSEMEQKFIEELAPITKKIDKDVEFDHDFRIGKHKLKKDQDETYYDNSLPNCPKCKGPLAIALIYPKTIVKKIDEKDQTLIVGFKPFTVHPLYGSEVTRSLYCRDCHEFFIECEHCSKLIIDLILEKSFSQITCDECFKPFCLQCADTLLLNTNNSLELFNDSKKICKQHKTPQVIAPTGSKLKKK